MTKWRVRPRCLDRGRKAHTAQPLISMQVLGQLVLSTAVFVVAQCTGESLQWARRRNFLRSSLATKAHHPKASCEGSDSFSF